MDVVNSKSEDGDSGKNLDFKESIPVNPIPAVIIDTYENL